jgi:hypothetical protein
MSAVAISRAPSEADLDDARGAGPLAELVELWRRVDALNSLPGSDGLSGNRALEAAVLVAKVRHAADALMAPYAARLDELSNPSRESRFARWKGFPSAAVMLSSVAGMSVSEAGKIIGLGHALAGEGEGAPVPRPPSPPASPLPDAVVEETVPLVPEPVPFPVSAPQHSPLAAAIRSGNLGTEKLTVIRRTLEDMTCRRREAEALLIARAGALSVTALRRLCFETFANLDPQGYAEREQRQYLDRRLSIHEEPDGMVSVYAKLPPAMAAPVKAWFEAELQSGIAAQRDVTADEQRTLAQILADAFVATTMHAAGCDRATSRPQSTFVIRATKSSLETQQGFATCDGIEAPITMGAILAMAADCQFAGLLTDDEGVPLKLGRTVRLASPGQRLAVAERDRGCAKCSRALSRANFHHIITWDDGGPTDERNLVMLCVGCHHQIHDHGWGVVIEHNQVWFVPPAQVDPYRRRQPGSSARLVA